MQHDIGTPATHVQFTRCIHKIGMLNTYVFNTGKIRVGRIRL